MFDRAIWIPMIALFSIPFISTFARCLADAVGFFEPFLEWIL